MTCSKINPSISFYLYFSIAVSCISLISCQHPLVYHWVELELQGKAEALNTELAARPAVNKIAANVTFSTEDTQEAMRQGSTPDYHGAPFQLIYPAKRMLQLAGDATKQRWFVEPKSNRNTIDVSAQIEDLYYHVITDIGVARALVSVRLHVQVISGQKQLLNNKYNSGKQYGVYFKTRGWELIGNSKEYETHYSRTVYKALLVALDQAMLDVSRIIMSEPISRISNESMSQSP